MRLTVSAVLVPSGGVKKRSRDLGSLFGPFGVFGIM
jgi:hypothetical protein